tara:strand:- start:13432 stop:15363 length:1932 start_codon:yes stop_codon:yes gene_type:complete
MGKIRPSIEEISRVTIEKMRADMIGTKYKLLNEIFVKAVDSGGKINTEDRTFQEQKSSLLNSDPDAPENQGRAVISMMGFEKGSKQKIDKLINKGAPRALFDDIERDTISLRQELTSNLSTEQGITELISDLMIRKASEVSPFQVRITKKEGMYNPGDTRPTNNMEASKLGELLTPGITLPKSVTSALMTDISSISKIVAPIFNTHMIKVFGQRGEDGIITLDQSKLTPENVKIFNQRVNNDLEAIPTREIVANSIIKNTIEKLKKESGYTISDSQSQRIADKLSPALAELDSEYLKHNSQIISEKIQKDILAKSTVTANIFGGVYIRESSLDKISDKLLDIHFDESDKYQLNLINTKLSGLRDSEISAKLTELGIEKAKAKKYNVNSISEQDLAQIRKKNPIQFDKIVFNQDNPVKNPKEVINSIIDNAIDKLKEENTIKLSPKKEAHLKAKFKKNLTPALSKLDPEYLKGQSDIISSNLQKELYNNKSIGYRFGKEFSVSTANLAKISNIIREDNQPSSNQFEITKVQSLLYSSQKTNTQLEKSLTDLDVAKAKKVKFKLKDMSAENLLTMREENPAKFDKIVLGIGKEKTPIISKKLDAINQAKQISVKISKSKATTDQPLSPPPLLSSLKHNQGGSYSR